MTALCFSELVGDAAERGDAGAPGGPGHGNCTIRLATQNDVDAVARLYDEVCDHLAATTNYPAWIKGVYPAREDAQSAANDGCLYVATCGEELAATMILRPYQDPAYAQATWGLDLADDEVLVIHTFTVSLRWRGQGLGAAMLDYAASLARDRGLRAVRLDVLAGNHPAIRLYKKCGFTYVDTVSLGMEERGLPWFDLYERLV